MAIDTTYYYTISNWLAPGRVLSYIPNGSVSLTPSPTNFAGLVAELWKLIPCGTNFLIANFSAGSSRIMSMVDGDIPKQVYFTPNKQPCVWAVQASAISSSYFSIQTSGLGNYLPYVSPVSLGYYPSGANTFQATCNNPSLFTTLWQLTRTGLKV